MEDKPDFKVKLGDIVQLQFIPDDGRDRLTTRIIGHVPNQGLILSAPSIHGKLVILRENQHFVVRMLQGSRVYGFESEVLKYYTSPYPHIHLGHPKDIECITVRGSRRVNTELVVSVQKSDNTRAKQLSVNMLNTSATGALLQTDSQLGELNDKLTISVELNIGSIQKYLRISAIIRNLSSPADRADVVDDKDDSYRHGVEFVELDEDQLLIINAYVHEQVVKQLEE